MKFITFKGKDINIDKICSIGEIKSMSTGNLLCDWDFGFKIKLEGGGKVKFIIETETDSCGNHMLSQKDRFNVAEIERKKFKKLIKNHEGKRFKYL